MAVDIATVETAINTILSSGQSVSVDGLSYTKANIDLLIKLRDKIKEETLRSGGTRPLFRGVNISGMGYE